MKKTDQLGLENQLKDFLRGRVVILGIGNSMRGDDSSGIELARRLRNKISAEIFEGGTRADNFIDPILNARPNAVLIIDCFDFKESPGAVKMAQFGEMAFNKFVDNALITRTFIDTLTRKTQANIALLAIQPNLTLTHVEMSKEVQNAIVDLEEILIKIFAFI